MTCDYRPSCWQPCGAEAEVCIYSRSATCNVYWPSGTPVYYWGSLVIRETGGPPCPPPPKSSKPAPPSSSPLVPRENSKLKPEDSKPKRALVGFSDRMPGPDWGYGPRDYVIVGAHADWLKYYPFSAPVTLTLASTDTDYDVVSETYDFMARGLVLAAGSVEATITCKDGTVVACVLNVQTVW